MVNRADLNGLDVRAGEHFEVFVTASKMTKGKGMLTITIP